METLTNFINDWWKAGAILLVVASYFIEISKIKINPISFAVGIIGESLNRPIIDLMKEHEKSNRMEMDTFLESIQGMQGSLEDIQNEQMAISRKVDINEVKRLRKEIMDFAASVRRRDPKSEESYKNIIRAHDEYNDLIRSTGLVNGVVDEDYAFIMKVYRNCSITGQFNRKKCYEKMEELDEIADDKQNI